MLPALVFLNFLIFGQLPWLSIPVLFMLVLLFVLMLPGYFSQEPNEARVMVFSVNIKALLKHRLLLGKPFHEQEEVVSSRP